MKALVTGMTGFIGSHLAEFLLDKGMEVAGTVWDKNELKNVEAVKDKIPILECDIRDENRVTEIIKEVQPDRIFHLAAQSFPTVSWDEPKRTLDTNVLGTAYVFEAIRKSGLDPIVLVACSSAEYGFVSEKEVPVKEDHVLLPLHPYGVSKVAQDLLAYQYHQNFAIRTVRARIFNTTGPRKTKDVCSDFTNRIVEIEKGKTNEMLVGNLEPKRDITDVTDVVNALWLLTEKGKMGDVYNICSSRAYRIKDILDWAISLSRVDVEFNVDPNKLRPTDEPIIMGDNTKIRETCGWVPKMEMKETLGSMLDYWREEIK
ncbi:MAG: GDP-mannose 4,6-dehydratase [Thermoplasmata archaeon]|nr:MAG: GDP-mannose 4,6-dehydratase [Thermoplasmata archaeon]